MMEVSHARVTGESPSAPTGASADPAEGADVGVPTDAAPICVGCDKPIHGVKVIPEAGPMHHDCAYRAMRGVPYVFHEPAYSFARWVRNGEAWCLQFWRNVRDQRLGRAA